MDLDDILTVASRSLEAGQLKSLLLILLIAGPLYFLFNVSRLLESFDSFRKRSQSIFRDYFDKDVPKDSVTEKVILDAREARYFKSIVGICAEAKLCHALIDLLAELSPEISWKTLKRSMRYLFAREGHITVRITRVTLFAYALYVPLYLLVSYILLILIQQFFLQPMEFMQQPNKLFYSLAYSLLFWALLSEIWTIHSAMHLWEKMHEGKTKYGLVKEVINNGVIS